MKGKARELSINEKVREEGKRRFRTANARELQNLSRLFLHRHNDI